MRFPPVVRAAWLAAVLSGAAVAGAQAAPPPPAAAVAPALQHFQGEIDGAKAAMMGDPGEALKLARSALAIARSGPADDKQPIRVATAQWLEGEALMRLNRPEDARAPLTSALATVAAREPKTYLHGRLTMAHGDLMGVTGQVQAALADFQAAYGIFAAANEPRSQAMALQNIGSIYQDAGDYERVLQYYAQSADTYKADPALLVSAYNNTANALKEQGKLVEAITEFKRALGVAEEMGSPFLQVRILENLASAEVLAGRLAAADGHIASALRMAEADPETAEWRPYLWGVSAQSAAKRGDLRAAEALIERTFQGQDLSKTTLVYRDFHKLAFEVYDRLGKPAQALNHLKAFKRLDDESRRMMASTNAALMAARFDFASQDSKIAKLKAAQLQKDIELARSRNTITTILLSGSGVLLCLLLVGLLHIRSSRNQVRAANAKLSDANASLERAVKARTEFLATTSHEVRTPLNGILGMTQVILADATLPHSLREKVSIVHGAGETMLALMNDILDAAKIESGNMVIEPVEMDLHRLLEETGNLWRERASSAGVELTVDYEATPERIVEDVTRLRQILFNLMSNAVKFTERGRVSLSVQVQPKEGGEALVARVSDTGIGIPSDRLDDVFESFRQVDGSVTRKYGGTGLGLAISRRLALAMGGDLTVQSKLGEGSVFTLSLPLRRAGAPKAAKASPSRRRATSFPRCVALVVEPNPLLQSLLRAALENEVRAVEVTPSAVAALQLLRTRTYDLILAEGAALQTPDLDPPAMVEQLAKAAKGARICLIWGEARAETLDELKASGADLVVRKPISTGDLVTQLRALWSVDKATKAGRANAA